jgi:hypothetical protein
MLGSAGAAACGTGVSAAVTLGDVEVQPAAANSSTASMLARALVTDTLAHYFYPGFGQ